MDVQSITITSTQTVPQPKPHTTYTIQIATPTRTWTVQRRYNDFVALHTELKASTGKEPPGTLPGKHNWTITRSVYNDEVIRERRVLLEQYLRTILTTKDPRWRTSFGFADFLAIPNARAGPSSAGTASATSSSSAPPPPEIWTAANWLTEHSHVQAVLRSARAALLKRDALAMQMSDASGARSASVEAKKLLKEASLRLVGLDKALGGLKGLGEGEKRRREELVEGLKGERDNLSRMADAGVRTSQAGQGATPSSNGTAGSIPGGTGSIWAPAAPQPGRVFGQAAKPQETEVTRPLDDRGLVQLQEQQVKDQDEQLGILSRLMQRQRKMGEEIHQELEEQNEILDHVDSEVTRVGGKLARTKRQMNRLN